MRSSVCCRRFHAQRDCFRSYDSRSIRAHLSYVSAEPALFSMTVASNIAYRLACCSDFTYGKPVGNSFM